MSLYDFDTEVFGDQFLPPRKRNTYLKAWMKVLLSPVQYVRDLFFVDYVDGNASDKVIVYSSAVTYLVGTLVLYPTTGKIYICISTSTGNAPTNATYFTLATFAVEGRIRYVDKSVYECILAVTDGTSPIDTTYWMKVQDSFIGLLERTKTNSQILLFEYLLNKWFDTSYNYPSTNDIYITNNPSDTSPFLFGVDEDESSAVAATDLLQQNFISLDSTITTYQFTINVPLAVYDALNPLEASGTTVTKDAIVKSFADTYVCAGIQYDINPY